MRLDSDEHDSNKRVKQHWILVFCTQNQILSDDA